MYSKHQSKHSCLLNPLAEERATSLSAKKKANEPTANLSTCLQPRQHSEDDDDDDDDDVHTTTAPRARVEDDDDDYGTVCVLQFHL